MTSTKELISITNQKQKMGMSESRFERNQRIEVIIDTLTYLVTRKVSNDQMKEMMKDLNNFIENS